MTGFSAGANSEQGFSLIYRLGLKPMFLFSGAFFPITNLAEPLEWIARSTPLWHVDELPRMCTLGTWDAGYVVHVAYLGALALHGQPFGFTREMLRAMREYDHYLQSDEDRELAERGFDNIEALLPPEAGS